jgi:O-antigen/teichoic acid export membrane protein
MPQQSLSNRRFILVMSQQFVGTVLKIMTGIVLARMLSTAGFGEFNAAYGVMMIASVLAGLGLDQFIVVPFRHAITSGDFGVARGLRRFTPLCIFGAAAVSYGILLIAHVRLEHHSMVEVESFAAVLALLPLVAMRVYLTSTANTHGAAGRAMFLGRLGFQLCLLALLGVVNLIAGDEFDVLAAAAVWAGALTLVCLALWRLNRTAEHPRFKSGSRILEWASWARGTFPYWTIGLVNVTLIQAPFVVLGWIHADGVGAAMFAAADRLGQLLLVFATAAMTIFAPAIADAIETTNRSRLNSIIRRWLVVVCPVTLASVALMVTAGKSLLRLYGDQYVSGYWILVVISTAIGMTMCMAIFLSTLQYLGGGRSVVAISATWTTIGFIGMIVMGHFWAEMGVAIAQGIGFIGMYSTMACRVGYLLKTRLPNREET